MALSKELLQRLIEASPDIVIATDKNGTVAYYNDGARANLGFLREEIIGRDVVQLYPSGEEARRVMAAMRDPNRDEKGRVVNYSTHFVSKDNQEIPVSISGAIVYDDDGRESGTIGFAKDIREIQRKDQLAVLGQIAIGLSHEINNPLATIVNHLDLLGRYLEEHATPADLEIERVRLETIRREVDRIESQIERLRQMSDREEYQSAQYLGAAKMIDLRVQPDEDDGSPPVEAKEGSEEQLRGRSVLVVDDDAAVRESVSAILCAEQCDVVSVGDGEQAVDLLEARSFDVVLSDVVMPGMDGYDLLQQTKSRWPETVVVLMTAFYHDRDHVLKRSRIAGLEGVLFKKPIRPEVLCRTLGSLLKPPPRAPSSR